MMGLRGEDVDLRRGQLVIERAVWRDIVDSPKGGRGRIIPMTDALAEAFGRCRSFVARGFSFATTAIPSGGAI
jgi:integrase